ncbi:MAG: 2-hydroxyacyl-CoA dehydratase, partial [Deltaproteobacteria bacterium]
MAEEKEKKRLKIKATGQMQKIMADYFYELNDAARDRSKPIAWCTSVGPAELLRAMGFLVHFPENHGAMLGATRMATDMIPEANAIGYTPTICSYLTADIGAYLKGVTPLSKAYKGIDSLPKPDVLVFNTNQCRDVQDWFAWYGDEFNVPVIGIYTHRGVKDVGEALVTSVAQQIKDLIPTLEEVSGNKFDMEELKRVLALSRECSDLWQKVLFTAGTIPSPLTFFD